METRTKTIICFSMISLLLLVVNATAAAFSDDFSANTTTEYTVTDTWTDGGLGQFLYDAVGQRVQVLTGDNIGLQFSHDLPPLDQGSFSIDFLPTQKYPSGGYIVLVLRQDANNYFELFNSDGYGAGLISKFVSGVMVDQAFFTNEYSQNNTYQITIDFSPEQTTVNAFGEVITINTETSSISVNSFEINTGQQDAYYDNIHYQSFDTTPPVWDSMVGIASAADTTTGCSVTIEFDSATDGVDGSNVKYNVYYAETSLWDGADWTNNSVLLDVTPVVGTTYTNAFTVAGLTDDVSYTFGVRVEDQSGNEDTNTNTAAATPTLVMPDTTPPVWDSMVGIASATDTTTGGSVTIEFDSATDGVDGSNVKYNVYYAETSLWDGADWTNNSVLLDVTPVVGTTYTNAFTVAGLTDDVSYTFGVRVEDQSDNEDTNTNTAAATPTLVMPDTTPPVWDSMVGIASATDTTTGGSVTIEFDNATDGVDGSNVKYNVYYAETSLWDGADWTNNSVLLDVTPVVGTTYTNAFTVTGLTDDVSYTFGVRVEDQSDNEDTNTNTAAATPTLVMPDTTPPVWDSMVGIASATDTTTGGSVTIEFDSATDGVDGSNVKYNVYYAETSLWDGADWTNNSVLLDVTPAVGTTYTNAFTVTGLTDDVSYTFGVRVEDQSGNEDTNTNTAAATPTLVVPDTTPPVWDSMVGIASAADTTTGCSVTIEFDSATDGVDGSNVKYNVYYAETSLWDGADWTNNSVLLDVTPVVGTTYTNAFTVAGLTDDVSYTFGVRVEDQSDNEDTNTNTAAATPTGPAVAFSDDFSADTTTEYTVTDTWTDGGLGQFLYDAVGQRVQVLTGDNIGLQFSHDLPPLDQGSFSIDFLPTQKYPSGGYIVLVLRQDANNYFELFNSDGYGAGLISKFVSGVMVDQAFFTNEYSQNNTYQITIDFSPEQTTVNAFGEVITINTETSSISVNSFEINTGQQDAYYDNIHYQSFDTTPPVWDSMVGIASAADTTTGCSVTIEFDSATDGVDGSNVKYNVYYAETSLWDGADWTNNSVLLDVTPVVGTTYTNAFTVAGLTDDVSYTFGVRVEDQSDNEDTNTNTAAATPTLVVPDTTPPVWDSMVGIASAADTTTGGSVTIEFDSATDGVDGSNVKYNVYYAETSLWDGADWTNNSVLLDVTPAVGTTYTNAFTVTGLTDDVSYTFGVRVEDQSGNEDTNTNTAAATPTLVMPDTTPPVWDSMVGIASATDTTTGGSVTIEFDSATDGVDGSNVKYNVYYAETSLWDGADWTNNSVLLDVTPVVGTTYTNAFTVAGLTDDVSYTFGVRVEDQSDNEDTNTNTAAATPTLVVPDTTPPVWDSMVGIASATDTTTGGSVTIEFDNATDGVDGSNVKYNVYYAETSLWDGADWTNNSVLLDVTPVVGTTYTNAFTVAGLTDDVSYTFGVRVEDQSDNEDTNTNTAAATPTLVMPDTTPPVWDSMVGIASATDTTTGGSVTIEFDSATDGVDGSNVKYNVYYAETSLWDGADWTNNSVLLDVTPAVGTTYTNAFTVAGLTDDVSYTFGVRVEDQSDNEDTNTNTAAATPTGPAVAFSDDFSADTTTEYTVTDTWTDGGLGQFLYDAVGQRVQVLTGDNIGLQFSHDLPPLDQGSFSIDFLPTQKYPSGGYIVLVLRQDANNYFELFNSDGYGAGLISKFVSGVMVDQAFFTNEYSQNNTYQITIDFSPEQTTVNAFGEVITINTETSSISVNSFEIDTVQQDAYYDNVFYAIGEPYVIITEPVSLYLQVSNDLFVEALAGNLDLGWGIKFVLDDGTLSEEIVIDKTNPYTGTFFNVLLGEHTIDAFVIDENNNEVSGSSTWDTEFPIGIGDYYVAVGDSITYGLSDDVPSDDISADGRNSGGGYEPILNDLLTSAPPDGLGYPHTIINEGVLGDTSADGRNLISSIISNHPNAFRFLVQYGTNDSDMFFPVPTGRGLNSDDPGYPGTFKDNMQHIIDAINTADKEVCPAKIPIALSDCSTCPPYTDPGVGEKNVLWIKEYNYVIDELIEDPLNNITIVPPDFYSYFELNYASEYADWLHPNGIGYNSMAELWHDSLCLTCIPLH